MTGIGTDIARISRFSGLSSHTLERIFTPYELSRALECGRREEYLASRFASKEAYVKALGTGFGETGPADVEVRNDEAGKPFLVVRGERKSGVHLSLSHDGDYAVAFVLIE